MKGVTISSGSSVRMTPDFRIHKKSATEYVAAKNYKHWPGVIEILEPITVTEWKSECPNKSKYTKKRNTKVSTEGEPDILKQEWILIDYEKQEELEDNYNNKLQKKLAKQAPYPKYGAALFIVLYGQLHIEIVTIAKNSIVLLYETVHKERDVLGLLFILHLICVQNLTGTRVDLYLEQLKILSSTLFYVQTKGISNHNFDDAIHDQVLAAQSQCGVFTFGENYCAKILNNDGFTSLKDYFSFDQIKKDKYDKLAREFVCSCLIINNSLSTKNTEIPQGVVRR